MRFLLQKNGPSFFGPDYTVRKMLYPLLQARLVILRCLCEFL